MVQAFRPGRGSVSLTFPASGSGGLPSAVPPGLFLSGALRRGFAVRTAERAAVLHFGFEVHSDIPISNLALVTFVFRLRRLESPNGYIFQAITAITPVVLLPSERLPTLPLPPIIDSTLVNDSPSGSG
jgi:hypothetical protein